MRMPVASIIDYLSSGMTPEQILKEWPELEPEDISQSLAYAAWNLDERILPLREIQ